MIDKSKLVTGSGYYVKLTSGKWVQAILESIETSKSLYSKRATTRYMFTNTATHRTVVVRSTARIRVR